MNDRYLYRAKRKNWRELPKEKWWVQGYLVNKKCGKYNTVGFEEFEEMVIVTQFSDGGIDWCYIEKDTICQCTGLKDKNGKLIWENDIVRYTDMITGVEKIDVIKWNETYASFSRLHRSKMGLQYLYIDEFIANECEVIGSAIDNPELLEVGE